MSFLSAHSERVKVVTEGVSPGREISVDEAGAKQGLAHPGNLAFISPQQMSNLLDSVAPFVPRTPASQEFQHFEIASEARGMRRH